MDSHHDITFNRRMCYFDTTRELKFESDRSFAWPRARPFRLLLTWVRAPQVKESPSLYVPNDPNEAKVVLPARVALATLRIGGARSILLSYGSVESGHAFSDLMGSGAITLAGLSDL